MRSETILSPLSRLLMGTIFVATGINKLMDRKSSIQYMQSKNMRRMTGTMLTGAMAVELSAGLALLLGYRTKAACALLAGYLVPTSLIFHDFWRQEGMEKQNQMTHFMKNVAIIGGLVDMSRHGAGAISLESRMRGRATVVTPEVPMPERAAA